jgi:integrase
MLRPSFSTVAAAIGFDVKSIQSQLGHSKPDMSYKEYVQPVDAQREGHMVRLEDILRGLAPMPLDFGKRLGSGRIQ